eukprot:4124076-Pyramimonas_sp.AAC.1
MRRWLDRGWTEHDSATTTGAVTPGRGLRVALRRHVRAPCERQCHNRRRLRATLSSSMCAP